MHFLYLPKMKYSFISLFVCFYSLSFGQKSNYNNFLSYNDAYLDKILYSQRYISSASDYLFYGIIKSVYIEQLDETGKLSGRPSKSFFDGKRSTIKRINYNNNRQEFGTVEYYYNPGYGGIPVVKSSFENQNGIIKPLLLSEIDTVNHIIINRRFVNEELNEIDTIFYIEGYKPIEIRTSSVKYIDKSVRKIAYHENGKVYKEVYRRNTSSLGGYIRYDNLGKQLYLYQIKFEEYDDIPVNYEDDLKEKEQEFIWDSDHSFEFREETNSIINFNRKEKKLQKVKKGSTETIYFNDSLLPVKVLSVDKKYGLNMEITFEYNQYDDLLTQKVKNEGSPMVTTTYQYVYDNKNNWIQRKAYENGKLIFTTKRIIEY